MSKKNAFYPILLAGLVAIFCSGCANQRTWVYHANTYAPTGKNTGKTIAALAYEDGRENKNSNKMGLYMIPLMPFGWQDLGSPEGVQMHMTSGMWMNYKPTEDYPKALAEDLRATGLFADAFFDYRRSVTDYAVKGKINSSKYHGRVISYGLSVYGPLLWLIGFPAGTAKNELSLDLSLVDSKTDKVLFSKTYTATPRSHVYFVYWMGEDFNYPEMLAEINKQFCTDVQPVLAKYVEAKAAEPKAP